MGKIGYTTEEVDKLLGQIETLKKRKNKQEIFQKTTVFRKWMPFHAEDEVTYFTNVIVCDKSSTTCTMYFHSNSKEYLADDENISSFFSCASIGETIIHGECAGARNPDMPSNWVVECTFSQSYLEKKKHVIFLQHPLFITKRKGKYYLEDFSTKNDIFKEGKSFLGIKEATRLLKVFIDAIRNGEEGNANNISSDYRCSFLRLKGSKSIYGRDNRWTRSHPHCWRWTTWRSDGWKNLANWVRRIYEDSTPSFTKIVRVQRTRHNNSRWCYLILKKCRSGQIGVSPLRKK